MTTWSISVKTVGNHTQQQQQKQSSSQTKMKMSSDNDLKNDATLKNIPSEFTVKVEANDDISILHDRIEEVTGLEACQQRLIYRGRLLPAKSTTTNNNNNSSTSNSSLSASTTPTQRDNNVNVSSSSIPTSPTSVVVNQSQTAPRVCDVAGLCDGQTIHLVPRFNATDSTTSDNREGGETTRGRSISLGGSGGSTGGSTANATSLLAALLGLGVSGLLSSDNENESPENNTENNNNIGSNGAFNVGSSSSGNRGSGSTTMRSASRSSNSIFPRGRYRSNSFNSSRNSSASGGGGSSNNSRRHFPYGSSTSRNNTTRGSNANASAAVLQNQMDDLLNQRNSLEPVRQSLLTLHTMLQSNNTTNAAVATASSTVAASTSTTSQSSSILSGGREWYRGQWLDVKDTVDQWLEATIVDIVYPRDILTPDQMVMSSTSSSSTTMTTNDENNLSNKKTQKKNKKKKQPKELPKHSSQDPIIGANDLEGRKRLLLDYSADDGSGEELRLRKDTDESTQLILVHYNGWPNRWDEWIRGDSIRIRPFRTRTRHHQTVSQAFVSFNMYIIIINSIVYIILIPNILLHL